MDNTIGIMGYRLHRHVLLEITKKCNLKCLHCFTNAGAPLSDELAIDDWNLAIQDLISNGFNAFTLSGGEPLLDVEKTLSIARYIKLLKPRAKVYLFTNGLLLSKRTLHRIEPYINGVGLSLDGPRDIHEWLRGKKHSFNSVMKALDLLQTEKVPIFIQSMITPQTIPFMEDITKICVDKGVKAIRFSHVDFYGRAIISKELIGCSPQDLITLSRNIEDLKKKYTIYITSNLVHKSNLKKSEPNLFVPALHILANGLVLPWYGFPRKFALIQYPTQTFSQLEKDILDRQMDKFRKVIEISNVYIYNRLKKDIIDYDNVIARFIN